MANECSCVFATICDLLAYLYSSVPFSGSLVLMCHLLHFLLSLPLGALCW